MTLSIIIVSYNVKFFLKQCLNSVVNSIQEIDAEIIVIDNDSDDCSGKLVQQEFPDVTFIQSQENLGFGKANNQAIKHASGKYLLYLNPDTIITQENLDLSIEYLNQNHQVGAIGIKMLDGAGTYHEESKRGFPSIWTAFSKLSGLYKLFSKSKFFNYYYLGHLSPDENQEVDVLCGAYMMARTELIRSLNGFDEAFFMYGEDIDLCKRIKQVGYKIMYLAQSSMIHFKGESSKKLDYKYIKSFYGSMFIYLKKHQNVGISKLLIPLFSLAVFGLAGLSYIYRLFSSIIWLLIDFTLLLVLMLSISSVWANLYHKNPDYYADGFENILIIVAGVYVFLQFIFGKYDEKNEYINILKAIGITSILSLIVYAVLPEGLRFSRFIIAGSGLVALVSLTLTYTIQQLLSPDKSRQNNKHFIVIGSEQSSIEINNLITESDASYQFMGFVSPLESINAIGELSDINNILDQLNVDQIIFSTRDIKFEKILETISSNGNNYKYQLASNDHVSILSSHSAKRQGNIITIDLAFLINNPVNKRLKRIFDFIMGITLLFLSPLLIFLSPLFRSKWDKLFRVIFGGHTMIGYILKDEILPMTKPSMFAIKDIFPFHYKTRQIDYVKSYSLFLDFEYLYLALLK